MKVGQRRFQPAWWSVALTLIGVALFVSLGFWQLERAAYKEAIQRKFDQRLAAPYQVFRGDENVAELEFRRLIFHGRFDNSRNLLVDNQLYRGRAGYHVLSPFRINDSDYLLLVNRGWIAWGLTRTPLPSIPVAKNRGEVAGTVKFPSPPALRLGEPQFTAHWPQLIPYLDFEALEAQFKEPLLPMILWLSPDQENGFVRAWNPVWMRAEKSRAYATQWFSFAGLAVILFVILNLRKY